MNERIAELLQQAFDECKTYEDGTMIRTTEALAKFAELIVKECAKVCEHNALYLTQLSLKYEDDIKDYLPRADESDECASLIYQHFGVEK